MKKEGRRIEDREFEMDRVPDELREQARVFKRVRADVERQMKKSMRSLSDGERAKLNMLFMAIQFGCGDLEKAAKEVGVSKALLKKLMNMPGISSEIAGICTAEIKFWSQYSPELQKDSRFLAKFCSRNLKYGGHLIALMAKRNDKRFFIELGKCLSGEIDSTLSDPIDEEIAEILGHNPWITAKDAVAELKQRGWTMTEEAFRVRKQRLKRTADAAYKAWHDWSRGTPEA
jgi:hypothetical protein